MNDKGQNYDVNYYTSHCGPNYERGNGWEEVFGRIADRIIKEINPKTVLDVGCAKGFLVEALRDRGVEAYGIDISEYAISQVREDIKPYCKVGSATEPFGQRYDLITNIEVLEHMEMEDIKEAITNFCAHTDDILFSSSPFDYAEESHINVKPIEFWVEQFAYNDFYHDIDYDVSYIAIQSMRFRKGTLDKYQLIKKYESQYFCKLQEITSVRSQLELQTERIRVMDENNIVNGKAFDTAKARVMELEAKEAQNESEIAQLKQLLQESEEARQRARSDMAESRKALKLCEEKCYVEQDLRKFLESELFNYKNAANERMNILNSIWGSFSWKITRPIRFVGRALRKVKRMILRNK